MNTSHSSARLRIVYPSWDSACRIPRRQRFDPIATLTWLILAPASAVAGWYGFWRALAWLISQI